MTDVKAISIQVPNDEHRLLLRQDSEVEVHCVWKILAAWEDYVFGVEALASTPVPIRVRRSRHSALQELLGEY